jgi:hypothetical protein
MRQQGRGRPSFGAAGATREKDERGEAERLSASSTTMGCERINQHPDEGKRTQEDSCENNCEGPEDPRP